MIHCLKKDQSCEAGSEQLQAQLCVLNEPNYSSPFQFITDSDIEQTNDAMADPNDDEDIDIEPLTIQS